MKKEQMVGTRLPLELVSELELIEDVEQSDRSTTVRRLLSKAVRQWKRRSLRPAVRGWETHPGTGCSRCRGIFMGDDGLRPHHKNTGPIRPRRSSARRGNRPWKPEQQTLESHPMNI